MSNFTSNETIRAILDRRSNRGYENRPLGADELDTLLQVALASPTGANRQAWHFSFCQNTQLLNEISDEVKAFITKNPNAVVDADYSVHFHAPLVVFISAPDEDKVAGATLDAGIAVENLAIAAQGMGLGSCILGMPRAAFSSEKGPEFEQRLQFPEDFHFKVAIGIGHPTMTKEAHVVGENKYTFID